MAGQTVLQSATRFEQERREFCTFIDGHCNVATIKTPWATGLDVAVLDTEHWQGIVELKSETTGIRIQRSAFQQDDADNTRNAPMLFVPFVGRTSNDQRSCYARGSDLVIRESVLPERQDFALEWYYRLIHSDLDLIAVECIVSVHTHLLHIEPRLSLLSGQQSAKNDWKPEVDRARESNSNSQRVQLQDFGNDDFLLFQIVQPADCRSVSRIESNECNVIVHELAPGTLEKGVIRRMRLLAVIGLAKADLKIRQVADSFLNSEIPLTV